jgi:hypothetical protein
MKNDHSRSRDAANPIDTHDPSVEQFKTRSKPVGLYAESKRNLAILRDEAAQRGTTVAVEVLFGGQGPFADDFFGIRTKQAETWEKRIKPLINAASSGAIGAVLTDFNAPLGRTIMEVADVLSFFDEHGAPVEDLSELIERRRK